MVTVVGVTVTEAFFAGIHSCTFISVIVKCFEMCVRILTKQQINSEHNTPY